MCLCTVVPVQPHLRGSHLSSPLVFLNSTWSFVTAYVYVTPSVQSAQYRWATKWLLEVVQTWISAFELDDDVEVKLLELAEPSDTPVTS